MLIQKFHIKKDSLILVLSKNYSKNIKKKKIKRLNTNPLKNIFGIGSGTASSVYKKYGLNNRIKTFKAKTSVVQKITSLINKLTFKNTLRNKQTEIRRFTNTRLKNYKGARHLLRYPVRGQRTHSNGKTRKRLKNTKYKNLT